jgi:hypothetical protein
MLRNAWTMMGVSLVMSGLGCKHRGEGAAEARTPAGQTRSAVSDISDARCDREERCDNIGPNKKHATRDLCEQAVENDWADDLNALECRGGVIDAELDECLLAIRDEDCGSVLDALDRFTSCSAADICAD